MKIRTFAAVAVFLLLVLASCLERYWPELGNKYNKSLVVDRTTSNNPGPYTISLSPSASVVYPKLYLYKGCLVSIIEQDGTTEILSEEEPGNYRTSPTGLTGEFGKQSKIRISTPDERTNESTHEAYDEPNYLTKDNNGVLGLLGYRSLDCWEADGYIEKPNFSVE